MAYSENERTVRVRKKLKLVRAREPTTRTSPFPTASLSSQLSYISYLATAVRHQFQF